MKRVQKAVLGSLWLLSVLASRVYLGILIGLVGWAVLPLLMSWQATVVMSGSMEPGINVGDVLVAQPLTQEQVLSTDFVTQGSVPLAYDPAKPEQLVTHRVVEKLASNAFVTKGDANNSNDSTPIPAENIIGLERILVPYIGIPIHAIRSGDFLPAVIFGLVTFTAQLIVMKDRQLLKSRATGEQQVPVAKPRHKAKRKNNRSWKKAPALALLLTVTGSASLAASGSHAAFSGVSTSAASEFVAAAYFQTAAGLRAVSLDGTAASAFSAKHPPIVNPTVFTVEAWFKTNSTVGGEIIGFADTASGAATVRDRALYLGNNGKIVFGVAEKKESIVQTALSYNDNKWHHVVLTKNDNRGWRLFVDGVLLHSDMKNHKTTDITGYWRIGGSGGINDWVNAPTNPYFSGSLDEVAVYNTKELTSAQVAAHYAARGSATSYPDRVIADTPSAYYRFEETAGPTAFDSSVNGRNAGYGASGVTYAVPRN
jgi:signal peptidase I